MGTPLRVLLVSDHTGDAAQVTEELERSDFEPAVKRVAAQRSLASALRRDPWDVVVLNAPARRLTVQDALKIVQEVDLDVPLLVVSESTDAASAEAAIDRGAGDFILREDLSRIGLAVRRELREAEARRAQRLEKAALAASDRQKSAMLDGLAAEVVHVDSELRVVWANRVAREKSELPWEEIVGQQCYQVWWGLSEPCKECPVEEVLRTGRACGRPVTGEDGRTWQARVYPLRDESGGVEGAVEVRVETTEDEQVAEAYRSVVDHSLQGIVVIGEEGVVFCNPATAEILGRSLEDLKGLSVDDWKALLLPEDLQGVQGLVRSVLLGDQAEPRQEFRVLGDRGSVRWMEMYVSPTVYQGSPAVQAALIDITDRKRAEEALRESEELYRTLVRTAPDGVISTDLEGRIRFASQRAAQMHGYDRPEDLAGKDGLELIVPDEREMATERMRRTVDAEAVTGSEYELLRRDGTTFHGEVNASVMRDTEGNPSGFIMATRNITARKQAEEALNLRVDQLSALAQASQALTASLELDQVLAEIVSLAGQVCASTYSGVVLLDEEGGIGRSIENLPGVPALHYRIREKGLTAWIVLTGGAAVVDEIAPDGSMRPDLGDGAPRFANPPIVEAGIRSLAGLPLTVKGRLLGVLYVHSPQVGAFSGQLPILTAFASQVAIAIENARLFQAEERQMRRLGLLADGARIVATTLDADELLQAIADSIRARFGVPVVGVLTLDEERQLLVLRGCSMGQDSGSEDVQVGSCALPIGRGITGRVARTRRPHLVPDVGVDPYYSSIFDIPAKSALWVPILDEERVVGVLGAECRQVARFDEDDQALMEALADTVAIGLRNARLYEETLRRVKELTLLNRIAAAFGTVIDMDTLIDVGLAGLHELSRADRAYFVCSRWEDDTCEMTHERAAEGVEASRGLKVPLDQVAAEVRSLEAAQPFAVADTATDPRLGLSRELYLSRGVQSFLLVPVNVGHRLHGALGFEYSRCKHAWEPDEVRLLEGVAHELELVLDNARLFDEARDRANDLAGALKRLEDLDRLKDEFIQNASHELRSPLAIIRGYAEMLEGGRLGPLQPDQQKSIAVISRRARMLGELVDDIALVLEAGASPPRAEAVALEQLARDAVEDFQVEADRADLTLRAEIPSGLAPATGSPTYLRRLLDNLLSNAVKFTRAGGTITVKLEEQGDWLGLVVTDTGVGIPEQEIDRIFERFYQVDGSARRRYGGVGLGLALVKEIAEAYGGRVLVESQVDRGTTFTVLLKPFSEEAGFGESTVT
jgi:PAS domain S-box-containing protein